MQNRNLTNQSNTMESKTNTKEKFFIHTASGLLEREIKEKFEFLGRTMIVHKEVYEDEWRVSDLLTGMLFFSDKSKAKAIKIAKEKYQKKPDYDFSKHFEINNADFVKGYNSIFKKIATDNDLQRQGAMTAIKEIHKMYNL